MTSSQARNVIITPFSSSSHSYPSQFEHNKKGPLRHTVSLRLVRDSYYPPWIPRSSLMVLPPSCPLWLANTNAALIWRFDESLFFVTVRGKGRLLAPVAHFRLHLLVDNLVDDRNGLLVGNDSLEVIFQAFDVVLILTSAELRRLSAMMIPPAVLYTMS